jgi:hypothetical protein
VSRTYSGSVCISVSCDIPHTMADVKYRFNGR